MESSPLPRFENPPVVETVLGVQFAPIERWIAPHFGLFWERFRAELPEASVHPPVILMERATDEPTKIEFNPFAGDVRCWFFNQQSGQLVQVQNSCFMFNWRRISPAHKYPSYQEFVRPGFVEYWQHYSEFLKQENLGPVKVVQCELSYVNHIPRGEGWDDVSNWKDVFTVYANASGNFLPKPSSGKFELQYLMPESQGRLRVMASRAIRQLDSADVIQLNLTVKGRPKLADGGDLMAWFDTAHEWAVRGFADLTTESMHKLWERKH
jgi:uncharacterized protein (TIGR04255 family)